MDAESITDQRLPWLRPQVLRLVITIGTTSAPKGGSIEDGSELGRPEFPAVGA